MARPNYGRGIQRLGQLATQYGLMRQQQDYDSWRQNEDIAAREELARLAHENALARDAARITAQNQGRLDLLNETDPMVSAPMPGLPGAGLMPGGGTARLSHLMDAANLDRQNKLLGVQQDREERLGQPEQLPPDYVMYDGYPMPGWRAWQYENPQEQQPRTGGRGTPQFDKTVNTAADEYLGNVEDRARLDMKTGAEVPYAVTQRGDIFNQGDAPLPVLEDMRAAFRDSVAAGHEPSQDTARMARDDVLGTVDTDLAGRLESDLNESFDGWQQREDGQMHKPARLRPDPVRPYDEFVRDVVLPKLNDGTNEVEWKTIEKWLAKKKMSFEDVLAPAVGGLSIGATKTLDGKRYRYIGGEDWVEVQ